MIKLAVPLLHVSNAAQRKTSIAPPRLPPGICARPNGAMATLLYGLSAMASGLSSPLSAVTRCRRIVNLLVDNVDALSRNSPPPGFHRPSAYRSDMGHTRDVCQGRGRNCLRFQQ